MLVEGATGISQSNLDSYRVLGDTLNCVAIGFLHDEISDFNFCHFDTFICDFVALHITFWRHLLLHNKRYETFALFAGICCFTTGTMKRLRFLNLLYLHCCLIATYDRRICFGSPSSCCVPCLCVLTLILSSHDTSILFPWQLIVPVVRTGLTFHAQWFSCLQNRIGLTHWGRMTHICVGKLTIIGSDNSLAPGRHQSIIWTNARILLIWPLGTNSNEILIRI